MINTNPATVAASAAHALQVGDPPPSGKFSQKKLKLFKYTCANAPVSPAVFFSMKYQYSPRSTKKSGAKKSIYLGDQFTPS